MCPLALSTFTFHSWCMETSSTLTMFAGCPAECELCVNSETCMRCRQGFYQLNGKCYHICPEDYEPNDRLMECTPQGETSVSVSGPFVHVTN